jgi:serine/threonine-protein kinase
VWAPNGRRVAFTSSREPPSAVFWQTADGTGAPERLVGGLSVKVPLTFTPDGTALIFREETQSSTASDLMLIQVSGSSTPRPLIVTDAVETNAEVSPSGRWLAYQSGQEIMVRPFPDIEKGRWHIGEGTQPRWSPDGRELFFLNGAGRLMAAEVKTTPTFSPSVPRIVLNRAYLWSVVGLSARTYDISPDGRRFLMIKEAESATRDSAPQMVVVLNWHEELKRLVPTR